MRQDHAVGVEVGVAMTALNWAWHSLGWAYQLLNAHNIETSPQIVKKLIFNANPKKPTPILFGVGLQTCNFRTPIGVPASPMTQIDSTNLSYPETILISLWLTMLSRRYMVVKILAVTSSWNFEQDSPWWNRKYSLCLSKKYLDSREIALIARIST
jgi:hypothetical protein